jgi:hypothetical protein
MSARLDMPLDATIVDVHGDRMVNLVIFDSYGKQFNKTSVTLIQEGDAIPLGAESKPVGGYCEWMPYQNGQAKKHEAVAVGSNVPGFTSGGAV